MFPAYKSFKALRTNDDDETQKWLKYWVIYAAFVLAQVPADYILCWSGGSRADRAWRAVAPLPSPVVPVAPYRLPLYYEFKVGFTLWLHIPQFQARAASARHRQARRACTF